jgi:hypothetical protein
LIAGSVASAVLARAPPASMANPVFRTLRRLKFFLLSSDMFAVSFASSVDGADWFVEES